ncbi:CHASE2 domain-containing protein [Nostoc sp. 'Peltigera membranacea cyanobiont' N6]|uniref:CHASE2 domain-containing protein n=1 Tax=Nostoc sp. 'Peltigera membranacea cyanobiont' N6 TaxID=1261031 RepID=UPI000CF32546|nr:CHASE2 domain-containing protein [Nostoc sp. 'Peltigera membranacea cyanobiont' N6]AVH64460.1 CHASE2 sensor domain-containing protein [Nostoc sp. 'Peltigera membranacea cyanobiont' N6]
MGKLVVLKFGEGSFEQGFAVTLQIGEEQERATTEITGKLPSFPEMPLYYSHWQSSYRQIGNRYRLHADKMQVTNVSMIQDCENTSHILRARFNTWLRAEEFRPLREKWLERLLSTEEVRVILQTENSQLQLLPWHLWDLLERYPKAEIALSSPSYDRIHKPRTLNPLVNILAIVGNSQGIDTQADRALLQQCRNADVSFLVEPQRKELTELLWGKNWDILFFAGHSSSNKNGESGRIYLNKTDSLTIGELKYALRKAIENGLQLAIFNSCDGLGLARELADLQIPQMIVMREPIPDQVAKEFLKYFLQGFAGGESLYQAVRQARERLQGLEDRFPCATWLPMICQNPAQTPPTWDKLWSTTKPEEKPNLALSTRRRLTTTLLSSLAITGLVFGVRWVGWLESLEISIFDQMVRSRPTENLDSRLLVITIDDGDLAIQRQNNESLIGASISEKSLNKVLAKLNQYHPRAIGLDIYRDFPAKQPDLITRLQQTPNLVGVCKGSDGTANITGIKPPPEIPETNLGFSDFIHDPDGVIRRHLLFMNQEPTSLCPATFAFSLQLASLYLRPSGIQPKFTPEGNLQLGKTIFPSLKSRSGGYHDIDANGGQTLLNYRSSKQIAQQVKLTQFLASPINPSAIKDKIILIGVTAKGDSQDTWATPYGAPLDEQMPGVLVQAQMISQILSAVQDGRPLLRVWSLWFEVVWIWGWSLIGGVWAWQKLSLPWLALGVSITSGVLYIVCFSLLISGAWVPFIPSILSLVATVSLMSIYNSATKVRVESGK